MKKVTRRVIAFVMAIATVFTFALADTSTAFAASNGTLYANQIYLYAVNNVVENGKKVEKLTLITNQNNNVSYCDIDNKITYRVYYGNSNSSTIMTSGTNMSYTNASRSDECDVTYNGKISSSGICPKTNTKMAYDEYSLNPTKDNLKNLSNISIKLTFNPIQSEQAGVSTYTNLIVLKPAKELIKINGVADDGLGITLVSDHSYSFASTAYYTKGSIVSTDDVVYKLYSDDACTIPAENVVESNIAQIGEDGTINVVKAGYCTLKVSTKANDIAVNNFPSSVSERTFDRTIRITALKNNPVTAIKFVDDNGEAYTEKSINAGTTFNAKVKKTVQTEALGDTTDVITWESSDTKIATVDSNGTVKGISAGKAVITCNAENKSESFVLTVITPATKLETNASENVKVGKQTTISLTQVPKTANEKVTWSSNNESVARVVSFTEENTNKQTVTVEGVTVGSCKLTATSENGTTSTITLNVNPAVKATKAELKSNGEDVKNKTVVLYTTKTLTLDANLFGYKDNDSSKEVKTSDDYVSFVVEGGAYVAAEETTEILTEGTASLNVTGVYPGTSVVKVYAEGSNTLLAKVNIVVKAVAETATFAESSAYIVCGQTMTLNPVLTNTSLGYTDEEVVSYVSSKPNVATVTNSGVLLANQVGSTVIKATTSSGKTFSCNIYAIRVSSVNFTNTSLNTTTATSNPTVRNYLTVKDSAGNAVSGAIYGLTLTSSNTNVATVSNNGLLTINNPGTTVITASCDGKVSKITVNVTAALSGSNSGVDVITSGDVTYDPNGAYNVTVTVTRNGLVLTNGVDYTTSENTNTNRVGSRTITVTGKDLNNGGFYTGTTSVSYNIVAKNLEGTNVTVDPIAAASYTGSAVTSEVVVRDGSYTLKSGTDYSLQYSNNVNAGTATVTITGRGNYTGTKTVTYTINSIDLTTAALTLSNTTVNYNGKETVNRPTVKINDKIISTSEYTVTYANNINPGIATVTVTGNGNYVGTISANYTIQASLASYAKVADIKNQAYTKKNIKPAVKVTFGTDNTVLVNGVDYTVSYKNNKKIGIATVTIEGIGNYTGTITKTFNIVPKKTKLVSVKSKKKGELTISWKKALGATSYFVEYSTNKKFKASATSSTIVNNATSTILNANLKSKKKYYVRVSGFVSANAKADASKVKASKVK